MQIVEKGGLSEWEFFVFRHQDTGNLWLHFVSYLGTAAVLVAAFTLRRYWLLLLLPITHFVGYMGHIVCEKTPVRNRDVIAPASRVFLLKIFWMVLTGKYSAEIARVNTKAAQFLKS